MTSNSATGLITEAKRLYSDSGSENPVVWIQPSISRQNFEQSAQIIDGLYVQVTPLGEALSAMNEIAREFAAWEAASDEALLNFEKENL
jgi:hypothetical protein